MVFFMVFIACSKAESINTMQGTLMLAWYQSARTVNAVEQVGNWQFQHSF